MKKIFFFAATLAALASCSTEGLVDDWAGHNGNEGPISFNVTKKNMVRSVSNMETVGHYNFGVFAYKSTDKTNEIMANYLVGYMDETNKKGYYMTTGTQSTLGDKGGLADGQSMWQYEGLGNGEYTYADNEGYYKKSETDFMSNVDTQYLRYWDLSSDYTCFYAYAPYINGAGTADYVDGTAKGASSDTYVMTIPNGTIVDGYDNEALSEYMYASAKVAKANYGHDVALNFKRLNAKVNIKFWEDIPGYSVRILDLKQGTYDGVQAAASIKKAGEGTYGYKAGKYYTANGAKIQFAAGEYNSMKQYAGTTADNTKPLVFAAPTDAKIGESRFEASPSATSYYAIPKGDPNDVLTNAGNNYSDTQAVDADLALTGFTFHVTYELTSTTGERIVVKNATVHVPAEYCNWAANTHYTYIFKITTNANGTTEGDPTIDPTDPEVPTEVSLYPIVFDNCTVEDWVENESEWEITEGTANHYYDVVLDKYSIASGDINVTVSETGADAGHPDPDLANVTVTPTGQGVTYDGAGTITVANTATAGVYTVTYTCHTSSDGDFNHPATWNQKFTVGSEYTVATHLDEIGTHSTLADAKLNISSTKDGATETTPAGTYEIEYPANFTTAQKADVKVADGKVVVAKTATPGTYKLVYKVEGNVVAKKFFEVKDYQFTLSQNVVENKVGGTTITANQPISATAVYTSTKGTVTDASIKLDNNTEEGTYVVTYTVQGDNAAKTVYTQNFVVKNTHAVDVDKDMIDRNEGATGSMTIGTDFITISTLLNGVATGDDHTALKIVDAAGNDVTSNFKITYTADNHYKLQVLKTTAAGNYKVVYTKAIYNSGDVQKTAAFRVVE